MKLYKFRKWEGDENTLKVLTERQLYFSPVDLLNDPMDCRADARAGYEALIADPSAPLTANQRFALNTTMSLPSVGGPDRRISFNDYVDEQLGSVGVLAFSLTANDPLMWAHYADGHKGVCFEFNYGNLPTDGIESSEVKYRSAPAFVTLRNEILFNLARSGSATPYGHDPQSRAQRFVKACLTTKSMAWVYEQEFRMVRPSPGVMTFTPRALTKVIFGTRTPIPTKQAIKELILANGFLDTHTAKVEPQPNSFEFHLQSAPLGQRFV